MMIFAGGWCEVGRGEEEEEEGCQGGEPAG
jgi:hypothetical protein